MTEKNKGAHLACRVLLCLSLVAAWIQPAAAVEVRDLYAAEVAFDPRAEDAEQLAYESALSQVLRRILASPELADSPEIRELFPNPARFVLQYRPGEGGPDGETLWVAFDGNAIERLLRSTSAAVWGADRPQTLAFVVVDDGRGGREMLFAPEDSHVEPRVLQRLRVELDNVARERGLPLVYPSVADMERYGTSLSELWGGFDGQVLERAAGEGVRSVLFGRVRAGSAERSRWTYYFGDEERHWNGAAATVLHGMADLLAARFALRGNEPLDVIRLTVGNLQSLEDFLDLQVLLNDLPGLEGLQIDAVEGDRVRFLVRINGGANRLASVLDFSGRLERAARSTGDLVRPEGETLNYRYRP